MYGISALQAGKFAPGGTDHMSNSCH
jgi:hypothetical protein